MTASEALGFPVIRNADGGPSEDGTALLVEAVTADAEIVRFALSLRDVQHFVAFLLVSAAKIDALREPGRELSPAANGGSKPIPVTSISVGEPIGTEGYLGIGVGGTELLFSLPMTAFEPVGRTMLTLSATPPSGGAVRALTLTMTPQGLRKRKNGSA